MRTDATSHLAVFKALASEVRLRILHLLSDPIGNFPPQTDGDALADGICGDFVREAVGLSASTVSRHLTILVDAGLVEATRKRGWTFYRRREEQLAALSASGLLPRASLQPVVTPYLLVDVFTTRPFGGNGLPVFFGGTSWRTARLQSITGEMRQFESVFVEPVDDVATPVRTRVFDLVEELPFAGHPLIGAAAALHHRNRTSAETCRWTLVVGRRRLQLDSEVRPHGYYVTLDQGRPTADDPRAAPHRDRLAAAFSVGIRDLHPDLPVRVVSTGLVYVVIPVREGALEKAAVAHDLTALVQRLGAQFAVLFDPSRRELRHWTNDGALEDSATGSAAGTLAAYCVRQGLAGPGETVDLRQGQYVRRPSVIHAICDDPADRRSTVKVAGDVVIVGRGELFASS